MGGGEQERLQAILASLVTEAPDILCGYADARTVPDKDELGILPSGPRRPDSEQVDRWIDISRALELDRILVGRMPPIRRARREQGVEWRHDGEGDLDFALMFEATARGHQDGLPWIRPGGDAVLPEVQLLATAIPEAIRSLSFTEWPRGGQIAPSMSATVAAARERLSRLLAASRRDFPAVRPVGDCRTAALSVLRVACDVHLDERIVAVARMFSVPWRHMLGVARTGMPLVIPGGDNFGDKAFELVLLARIRNWLMSLDAAGTVWSGERMIKARGEPILRSALGGEKLVVHFQSSLALPRSLLSNAEGPGEGAFIPDIVMALGEGPTLRHLVVDAKNYGSDRRMGREMMAMVGALDTRGIVDKRVFLVRPDPSPAVYLSKGRSPSGSFALAKCSMPLGPGGVRFPGAVVAAMLAPLPGVPVSEFGWTWGESAA